MWDKYINVPFKPLGRDFNGSDCWGLVRLVYINEYNIELPSFSEQYSFDDSDRIAELIAQFREGWEEVNEPSVGDIVLFKVLGQVQHIGVYLGNNKFLHLLEGYSSVIESTDSMRWRSRVAGYFKYSERSSALMTVAPHPLKTESFTFPVPIGTSVEQVHQWVVKEYNVSQEIVNSIIIILNGRIVPKEQYSTTIIKDGDSIQYRALAGKGAFRIILFIVLAIAIPHILPYIGGATGVALTTAAGGLTAAGVAVSIGLHTLGGLLINAIAPIRPPSNNSTDPGTSKGQNLMAGSQNQANPYGAIPVVLGRVRMTGVLGAQSQVDSGTDTSYLRTLLVWGFAPLEVSDIRIGATSIDQYDGTIYASANDGYPSANHYTDGEIASLFMYDSKQQQVGVVLANNPTDGNPWAEVSILQPKTIGLDVNLHFPQGLRTVKVKGDGAGNISPKECLIELQWRPLDINGIPVGIWKDYGILVIDPFSISPANATYLTTVRNWDGDTNTTINNGYRWLRVGIRESGTRVYKIGAIVDSPYAEPLVDRDKNSGYNYLGVAPARVRLPAWEKDIIPMADICCVGHNEVHTIDLSARLGSRSYTGLATTTGTRVDWSSSFGYDDDSSSGIVNIRTIDFQSGVINKIGSNAIVSFGITNYVNRKDAFSHTVSLPVPVTTSNYQLRARRINSDIEEPDDTYRHMHQVVLQYVTAKTYVPKLTIPTNKFDITRTALSIKATDQLNSNMEGINAFVETICLDWTGTSWVRRVTNNPASLFRLVLQHTANAFRITDAEVSTKINLAALQEWHNYCKDNDFTFNAVVSDQTSIMDILRDISAAGRASPAIVDGKWTVIIDRPRTEIVQHFTTANSWGFEAIKALPKMPDGLKVAYFNEEAGFQQDELIVYAPGKSAANSSLFERISLPGITRSTLVYNHARWAMAQGILRPEVYTINTDLEYLVCSRGSRVKIVNDVPMWGLGSGRIASIVSSSVIMLTEPVPMSTTGTYLIRIRSKSGTSAEYTVAPPVVDGYYTEVTISPTATVNEVDVGDVFMFGSVETDFIDLVVQTVEPFGQKNAKLTLTSYAPELYSIDYLNTNFTVPNFDPNITTLPKLLLGSIFKAPTVSSIISDERVLVKTAPGVFTPSIKVSVLTDTGIPSTVTHVVAYIFTTSNPLDSPIAIIDSPISLGSLTIHNVNEGATYYITLRYKGADGRLGPKSEQVAHTVIGKSSPPSNVINFTAEPVAISGGIYLSWDSIADIDIQAYEVRATNTGWGIDSNYVYRGLNTNATTTLGGSFGTSVFYVKAIDTGNRYSVLATSASILVSKPAAPTGISHSFTGISPTDSTVTISWNPSVPGSYTVSKYTVNISNGSTIKEVVVNTTEVTTPVIWTSNVTVSITAVDVNGITSTAATYILVKSPPNVPATVTANIVDNSIELAWKVPVKTSLPITLYEVRNTNTNWGDSSYIWRGSATSIQLPPGTVGSKTYYIKSIDSAGEYSTTSATSTISITAPGQVNNASISISYSDTNISGAISTLSWSPSTVTALAIDYYLIQLTKYTGPTVTSIRVSGTSAVLPVDWKTSVSVSIIAVDTSGNQSINSVKSFTKTAPTAPATSNMQVINGITTISWAPSIKGTLPIDGYEVRSTSVGQGTPGFLFRGSTLSTPVVDIVVGANDWFIWAYDTDGQYSSTYTTATINVTVPSIPQSLSSIFSTGVTGNICTFKWVTPTTLQYPLKHYQVSFTYTNPITTTLTNISNTTEWAIPVSWIGNGTLSVIAVDILGNTSTAATLVVGKVAPGTVGAITGIVSGNYISLDWAPNTTTSLPVTTYEIRTVDTGWGDGNFVYRGGTVNVDITLPKESISTITWYVRAIDNAGQYSAISSSLAYTLVAPTAPLTYPAEYEDTSLTAATVTLFWEQSSSPYGIRAYEVSHSSGAYLEIFYATTVTLPANWLGDRTFSVRAIDNLNNYSAYSYIVATKLAPNPIVSGSFKAQVIDNDVLLYWTLPAKTTLPISHVILKKGATWETATVIGNKDGTFTSISELVGGNYTYWIAVVDTDDNTSVPSSLVTSVSQPPNFVFNAEYYATKANSASVVKVNALHDTVANTLVLPVNTAETFTQHFTTNSWTTPAAQIAAGYPIYIQPGLLSGSYQEVFDYGTTLGSSQITVSLNGNPISGNPEVILTLAVSTNNITYTDLGAVSSAFAVNFRYVKVLVTVTQVVSGDIYSISDIIVRLDAKQKSDSGTVTLSVGGAIPQGNLAPEATSIWVPGNYPPIGFYPLGLPSENSITYGAGPGGSMEPLWNSIDADVAYDGDGGWAYLVNPPIVDNTKGHLLTVFVKTLTNSGHTYWGTSQNNTIANLSGVANNNPYFWNGDLPALNTWYLIVGYVYPVGYGTTDDGISGLYNMSGTKVLSGTSYKLLTGNTINHRCFNYYNVENTGLVTQQMARPIIKECAVSDVSSTLAYILKCSNTFGASVPLANTFIDISALNATAQGQAPVTTVIDFTDIPNPKRFNIFNYDSSGAPIGGTVSWSATGY